MKTPEQIAHEVATLVIRQTADKIGDAVAGSGMAEAWRQTVIAAIEADRAQLREVKAQAWREGWDASERFGYLDGVLETPLNPYLEADDDF